MIKNILTKFYCPVGSYMDGDMDILYCKVFGIFLRGEGECILLGKGREAHSFHVEIWQHKSEM